MHRLAHAASQDGIFQVIVFPHTRNVCVREAVRPHAGAPTVTWLRAVAMAPARAAAAVMRRADQFALRVIVGRVGVLVQIQAGKPPGALAVALVGRVGQAQKVEVDVAFALVELVVSPLILVQHRAEFRQLFCDSVPLPLPQGEHMIAAAEQIVKRPVV